MKLLDDYPFARPTPIAGLCAARIAEALSRRLAAWGPDPVRALELLETVFYRERRAYLVGRVFGVERIAPLVIAPDPRARRHPRRRRAHRARERGAGVQLRAATSRPTSPPSATPWCSCAPCCRTSPSTSFYTVLGRAKQGKTERYRHFVRHLAAGSDEASCTPPASAAW